MIRIGPRLRGFSSLYSGWLSYVLIQNATEQILMISMYKHITGDITAMEHVNGIFFLISLSQSLCWELMTRVAMP